MFRYAVEERESHSRKNQPLAQTYFRSLNFFPIFFFVIILLKVLHVTLSQYPFYMKM